MVPPPGAAPVDLRNSPAPQPAPTNWKIDPLPGKHVQIVITSHNGQFVFFVTADEAKSVGALLERVGTQAQTGLILPPNGLG